MSVVSSSPLERSRRAANTEAVRQHRERRRQEEVREEQELEEVRRRTAEVRGHNDRTRTANLAARNQLDFISTVFAAHAAQNPAFEQHPDVRRVWQDGAGQL